MGRPAKIGIEIRHSKGQVLDMRRQIELKEAKALEIKRQEERFVAAASSRGGDAFIRVLANSRAPIEYVALSYVLVMPRSKFATWCNSVLH